MVKIRVMVKMRVKIVYINVLMRLVSIRGGSLNSSWLPPSKVDRSNENDRDDDNESDSDSNDKDNDEDNKDKDKKCDEKR